MKSPDRLHESIILALEEERKPRARLVLKASISSILLSASLAYALSLVWSSELQTIVITVGFSLLFLLSIGFLFYFMPQPRIKVPGFWMPWMWGKLLIGMSLLSVVQLMACPDLAGIIGAESYLPWLSQLTHFFMHIGGMKTCMIMCGLLFSAISSTMAFFSLRKILSASRFKWILFAVAFSFLGQLPVIICQAMQGLESFPYWITGSLLAIFVVAFAFRKQSHRQ